MAKKVPPKASKAAPVEVDEDDEVAQRRKAREAEAAARAAERKAAWQEHATKNKETEERRKASEPDKAFAEAARKAKARAEQERIDLHQKSYETEAKRRNPDEKTEARFRSKHDDVLHRHMAAWANLQEISQGADIEATREALQVMARCWKEKEDLILAFPKKKKSDDSVLEARTESLKEKLAEMAETRKKVTPKPPKKKRPVRRPKEE
jgi:hypothetical protein